MHPWGWPGTCLSPCLSLLSAGITGVHHLTRLQACVSLMLSLPCGIVTWRDPEVMAELPGVFPLSVPAGMSACAVPR
jgi:hypothetical protein